MSLAAIGGVVPVAVDVTFLRMDAPPTAAPPPWPEGATVALAESCSVAFYRYLYGTVGFDYVWWLRRTLTDAELRTLLADPAISIHVGYQRGEPAGFYELDRRNWPLLNLAYFGLMPQAIGHGLGRALLRHAVDSAWNERPRAVTVNTCTADHRRALPNYLLCGFEKLRTVREVWRVPTRLGLPIPEHLKI
jgi:GNAT superfamily N-acetyltransferase